MSILDQLIGVNLDTFLSFHRHGKLNTRWTSELKLGASGFNVGKRSRSEVLDYLAIRSEFEALRKAGGEVDELMFTDCALGEELTNAMARRGLLLYPTVDEMERIREIAREIGVEIGGHASFLINLASPDSRKRSASRGHITALSRRLAAAGGIYGVMHLGFIGSYSEEEVKNVVQEELEKIIGSLEVQLLVENAGKRKAVGSLQFVLDLAENLGVKLCIDWAHLHAYTRGGIRSEEDAVKIIDLIENRLGKFDEWVPVMHISGIKYGAGGEIEHLGLLESDFNWYAVMKVLIESGVDNILICESPKRWTGDLEILHKVLLGEKIKFKKPAQRSITDWIKDKDIS